MNNNNNRLPFPVVIAAARFRKGQITWETYKAICNKHGVNVVRCVIGGSK